MSADYKPITEAELDQWDAMCHCSVCSNDTETPMRRLIAEVRRLRAALTGANGYVLPGCSRGPASTAWIATRRQMLEAMPELRDATYDAFT